jgi:transcriptional regulator with GAF, ATPase, and Fis domain
VGRTGELGSSAHLYQAPSTDRRTARHRLEGRQFGDPDPIAIVDALTRNASVAAAARALGLPRTTLQSWMGRHGVAVRRLVVTSTAPEGR